MTWSLQALFLPQKLPEEPFAARPSESSVVPWPEPKIVCSLKTPEEAWLAANQTSRSPTWLGPKAQPPLFMLMEMMAITAAVS